jgi:spermidine synthase
VGVNADPKDRAARLTAVPGGRRATGSRPLRQSPEEHEVIGRSVGRDGSELVLVHRDGTYQIRVDGRQLMDSRNSVTERDLARLALRYLPECARPRVLVGGLGLGYTLRAALDLLPAAARVTVVEVSAAVVRWNRGPLGPLAGRPLADPRVNVVLGDVRSVLAEDKDTYHAVLLDVDNGPHDLALPDNRHLYGAKGLTVACGALSPGGVLAVWSSEPAPELVERLLQLGVSAWSEPVWPTPEDSRVQHAIIIACRPDA